MSLTKQRGTRTLLGCCDGRGKQSGMKAMRFCMQYLTVQGRLIYGSKDAKDRVNKKRKS